MIIKKVLLGITTLVTATATTSTISIILSFPITTADIVTTLTATLTTATDILPFQERTRTKEQHLWSRTCSLFQQPCTDTVNNEILHQANLYGQQYLHSHDVYLQQHPRA